MQLSGSSTTSGATFSWAASGGGNIVSGATTATPTVNAAGTYVLTVTTASGGCTAKDTALVTSNTISPNANAGPDKQLTCTLTSTTLSGASTTSGATFSWSASGGGNIVSGGTTAAPTVNAAGTYTLKVTNPANGCTASDVALVTTSTATPNVSAGAAGQLNCSVTSINLSGGSTTAGATFAWVASGGGNIIAGANTATPTVNAAGTYTLTITNPANGCTASSATAVTLNNTAPNVSAGTAGQLTCTITSINLSGSSSTAGATFAWLASGGGNITTGANTATPTVNAAGTYTLTVTNPANGCTASTGTSVTLNNTPPNVNAGPDVQLTCPNPTGQLSGSSTTPGALYSWMASDSSSLLTAANIANPIAGSPAQFVLTVTNPSNGCMATDTALVIFIPCIYPYYPPPPGGKVLDLIGSELNSLSYHFSGIDSGDHSNIFQLTNDSVYIEVIAKAGEYNALLALLQSAGYGMTNIISNGANTLIITGKFPIANLLRLDSLPNLIDYARPLYPPITTAGVVTTGGDTSIKCKSRPS